MEEFIIYKVKNYEEIFSLIQRALSLVEVKIIRIMLHRDITIKKQTLTCFEMLEKVYGLKTTFDVVSLLLL